MRAVAWVINSATVLGSAIILGAAARPLAAQVHSLDAGRRVRVEREGLSTLDGRLVTLSADSITLALADSSRSSVAWRNVSRVRVDLGPASFGRRGMRGGFVGLLVGAAAGVPISQRTCLEQAGQYLYRDRGCQARAWVATAAGGFLLGFVVGSLIHADHWETLSGWPVKLGIFPRRLTVAIGVPVD